MKELSGTATAIVTASPERCYELVADIDGYPRWYPDAVRSAEVVERDPSGRPTRARARLHATLGPIDRDFDLLLAVAGDPPRTLTLTRIPHDGSDPEQLRVAWRIHPGAISVDLLANLSIPRLVPVGSIGETMARGFAAAAARELGRSE